MYAYAIGRRSYWPSKVTTLPKWRQHYDDLRTEWLSGRAADSNGNGGAPERKRPTRMDLSGDRIVVS